MKGGLVFNVDTVNGNDLNDGLAATTGAFKTIGAAVLAIYQQVDCQNGNPQINIAAGTYTESVTLFGQITGGNFILFQGVSSASVTWKPSTNFCLLVGDNAECQVSGIKFDNTSGANNAVGISFHQYSVCDVLNDIQFGTFPGTTSAHMNNDKGGYINLPQNYTITGSAAYHIQVASGCVVTQAGGGTISIQNTPTFTTFYFASNVCSINFNSAVTYTGAITAGAKQYSLDQLSCFVASGSTIPGTVAGTAGHGSQFS